MIGTRLLHYEIKSHLGSGGMGDVYQATDSKLGRSVAVKFLPASFASDPEHLTRFEREARVLASLNHPNIAAIHGLEESGNRKFLVMELVAGETLAERLQRGPVPVEEAVAIARQIAGALEAAHGQGVIHRDLKPANIKVRPDGTVKLLDFGIAKFTAPPAEPDSPTLNPAATREGIVLGTAAYMAPEQARGEATDARSDIFSLGVVLYEMLSGKRAFNANSTLETLNAVVSRDPEPFASPAEDVVKRCLMKQPAQRFQRMTDVQSALRQVRTTKDAEKQTPSVAVLPFANMSRDADDEYFSDGLAEEIINALAQMPGLKVIARTSAFAFKGKNEDIRKIAETLGVTSVLEGSVRRAGSRIRVTAQLIQASDGTHLWSQRYDREMVDIFAMQDEISAAIAEALKVKLSPVAERRMPKLPAYEAYLKYRSYQWQFTPEAAQRSRECLERAIALDPQFALPYVGMADYYFALSSVGAIPAREAMPKARELAQRALEIDPELPEAHAMLGIVAGNYDYDWTEAQSRFRRAVAREPLSPHLRQWYASFLLFPIGQVEEARRQVLQTIDDDPLCQMWHLMHANILEGMDLDEQAMPEFLKALELDPQFWLGWLYMGIFHASKERLAEAWPCAEKALAAAPWCPYSIGMMAGMLTRRGQAAEAQPLLDTLQADESRGAPGMAVYKIVCGEMDSAIHWLQKAADHRFTGILNLLIFPFKAAHVKSPKWPDLLKKVNLG